MARKRAVDEVLDKDAVTNVHPETPRERILRILVADIERVASLIIVVVGLLGSVTIMLFVEKLQTNAFQLFSAIITGGLGYFFGKARR